ncbi:MAG: YDG domain-containing protein [Evtepia gabavorous]
MRERIRRNVGLGMAVILLVSSLGVPPASAGTVREGKSLAEAEMAVLSGPVEYNGSEQKPKVSIHLDGVPLREGVDYRLSYADNLDAGTAVVMATGTGAYHGSREAKFTILPRTISAQALQIEAGCQKKYDETTEAFPTVSVQVLPGDQVEVRCTAVYDTCFVGKEKDGHGVWTALWWPGWGQLQAGAVGPGTKDHGTNHPPTAGLPKVCCIGQGAFPGPANLFLGRLEGGGTVSADRRGPGLYPAGDNPHSGADTWDRQAAGDDDWLG